MMALRSKKLLSPALFCLIIFLGSTLVLKPLWQRHDDLLVYQEELVSLNEKLNKANAKYLAYQKIVAKLRKEKSQLKKTVLHMDNLQALLDVKPLELIDVKPKDFDAQRIEITLSGSYSSVLRYIQKQFLRFSNIHLLTLYGQRYVGSGRFTIVWGVDDEMA